MAFVLRMVRLACWDTTTDDRNTIPSDQIPADPLADFARTSKNSLSVWQIDADKKNIDRIITALAATRNYFDKFDYVLFRKEFVNEVGIATDETKPGDTPDDKANKFHFDLTDLTIDQVVTLTKKVYFDPFELNRVSESKIKKRILAAVADGQLEMDKINRKLRQQIEDLFGSDDGEQSSPPKPK